MQAPQTLFLLGYIPNIIGVFFYSIELLVGARPDATEALTADLAKFETELAARRGATIANVRRLEELLETAAIPKPEPPRTPEQYHEYRATLCERISAQVEPNSTPDVAFLLGWVLGDACLTLNLLSLNSHFLALDGENSFLQVQTAPLQQSLRDLVPRLAALAGHPALAAAVQVEARMAHAILESAIPQTAPAQNAAATPEEAPRFEQLLRALSVQIEVLERALPQA